MTEKSEIKKKLLQVATSKAYSKNFSAQIKEAEQAWAESDFELCEKILEALPKSGDLLRNIVLKLKGKRVHKTLKVVFEGKGQVSRFTKLKAFTSLFTHTVIECEQGAGEYEILLPWILGEISKLTYRE